MSTETTRAFSIRRCTTADAAIMALLGARLFAETYGSTHPEPELSRYLGREFSVNAMRDAIASDQVTMFIVDSADGNAIGYAYLRVSPEPAAGVRADHPLEIVRFYVDRAYQGRGIGAALMEECVDEAKKCSADVVWLQVWKEAPWAVGFYSRMGFSVVGSAPFYFGDQVGDDHIMAKAL